MINVFHVNHCVNCDQSVALLLTSDQSCVCLCVKGCSQRELPSFDQLSGDESLSVDEALRLELSPLDLNDIDLLTDTDWVADADAEEQLRLDQYVPNTDNYYRPF